MSRREDVQKLIISYDRRLQKLREQKASKGINTPPDVLIEIEDIEDKLAGLEAELETASTQQTSSLTDDDLARELNRLSDNRPTVAPSTQTGGFNLSNVSGSTINIGNVKAGVTAGRDVVGRDKITTTPSAAQVDPAQAQAQLEAALAQWRQEIEAIVARLDDEDDQAYVRKTAAKMHAEAKKGQTADPGKIEGFLQKMSNMGPDILEVTATTLQNPFKGVGLVLEKINDRIKLEQEKLQGVVNPPKF